MIMNSNAIETATMLKGPMPVINNKGRRSIKNIKDRIVFANATVIAKDP